MKFTSTRLRLKTNNVPLASLANGHLGIEVWRRNEEDVQFGNSLNLTCVPPRVPWCGTGTPAAGAGCPPSGPPSPLTIARTSSSTATSASPQSGTAPVQQTDHEHLDQRHWTHGWICMVCSVCIPGHKRLCVDASGPSEGTGVTHLWLICWMLYLIIHLFMWMFSMNRSRLFHWYWPVVVDTDHIVFGPRPALFPLWS